MTDTTRNKGRSLIDFPDDYIVFDLETTGIDPYWDEIIEIGAFKYSKGNAISKFHTLIKPKEPVSSFITELTGITNEMVKDAPVINDALPYLMDYFSDSILVGHNVNFDINFVYDAWLDFTGFEFKNDFIDTLRIARRVLKDLHHHRLSDLREYYRIENIGEHRSLADCLVTQSVFMHLKNSVIEQYGSVDSFKALYESHPKRRLDIKDIKPAGDEMLDPENLLYGKEVVITGSLERMVRADALQLVANIGGYPKDSVTSKTNYLVLGNNDYCKSIKDGKSNKQKKAEKMKLEGKDIEIISESVFYEMLGV